MTEVSSGYKQQTCFQMPEVTVYKVQGKEIMNYTYWLK